MSKKMRRKPVKRITAYTTTDGAVHVDKAVADLHQAELDFRGWYEDHKIYGTSDSPRIDADDIILWLQEYQTEVGALLGFVEAPKQRKKEPASSPEKKEVSRDTGGQAEIIPSSEEEHSDQGPVKTAPNLGIIFEGA